MDPQTLPDIFSTLPTEKGWLSDETNPLYYYQGFWYSSFLLRGAVAASTFTDLSPSDIILASSPKGGTTWLKALSFAIATRTRFTETQSTPNNHPLTLASPHDLVPYLEIDLAQIHKPRDPNLPLVATHLPYSSLPALVTNHECKIVYVWRDPKDAFISRWHFYHKMRPKGTEPISLEEAFDLFCRGVSPFGPYWDHILGYHKALLEHPDRVLFLKYEDLLTDVEVHVKRLAGFLGYPFSSAEENEGVVQRIVEMCSFESLKDYAVNKGGALYSKGSVSITRDAFFRKGEIGDWKNYLNEEMATKIDRITVEKLGGTSLLK